MSFKQNLFLLMPPATYGLTVQSRAVQSHSCQPHVTTEHLKHGLSQLRCALSVKYAPDFKDGMKQSKMFHC